MFNTSNLTDFTVAATDYLRSAVLFSDDYSRWDIMTGVKHKEYLNYLDAQPILQSAICGGGASGTTSFDEKEVSVVDLMYRDQWCLADLNKKDQPGEFGTLKGKIVPNLATALFTDETDKIKQQIDRLLFQGKIATGSKLDGIVTKLVADADVIKMHDTTGVTLATISNIVEDLIMAVPEEVEAERGLLTINMSIANFRLYKKNRIAANLYWDNPAHKGLNMMDVFGYDNVVVRGNSGMIGDNDHIYISWEKNFVLITDELSEISTAKIYFDENTDYVKYKSSFKLGIDYRFAGEIVLYYKG